MLRITVIALVVANLILVGFEISKPEKKPAAANIPAPAHEAPPGPTDPGIPTIRLYSEIEKAPGLLADNRHCYTLGPFHTRAQRDSVRRQIDSPAASVDERQTEAMVDKGYWVFLPPYSTLAQAGKTVRFLKLMGLDDVGVLYEGEHARGVSLGYFQRRKNALKRKKSLEAKGYEPRIQRNRQAEPRFWLDYELAAGAELPALDLKNLPVEFSQRTIPCGGAEAAAATEPASEYQAPAGRGGAPKRTGGKVDGGEKAAPGTDATLAVGTGAGGNDGAAQTGVPGTQETGEGADTQTESEIPDPERPKATKGPPH